MSNETFDLAHSKYIVNSFIAKNNAREPASQTTPRPSRCSREPTWCSILQNKGQCKQLN